VHEAGKLISEEIGRFVEASAGIRFEGKNREQVYGWVERALVSQENAQRTAIADTGLSVDAYYLNRVSKVTSGDRLLDLGRVVVRGLVLLMGR
jgi:hypothetical protein